MEEDKNGIIPKETGIIENETIQERPVPPKQVFIKEKEERMHGEFCVDTSGFLIKSSYMMFVFSILFRIYGCMGMWNETFFLCSQIILPIFTCVLFAGALALGKKTLIPTVVPVLLGVVFFIFRIISMREMFTVSHVVSCIALYVSIFVVWAATVFGYIRTKWILVPMFGGPFLYHLFYEDLMALQYTAQPVSLSAGLQEVSVLFIMLAMLFTALAMKKKKPDVNPELPKIKDPVVKIPGSKMNTEQEENNDNS